MPVGQRPKRRHVHALTVEVHRQQGAGPWRDRRRHQTGVHEVVVLPDIDKDRNRADRVDGHDGGRRRVRHGDHLVTGADIERLKAEFERVRAVVDADTVGHAVVGRELLLESPHARTEHQLSGAEDLAYRVEDVILLGFVFLQVVPHGGCRGHGQSETRPASGGVRVRYRKT